MTLLADQTSEQVNTESLSDQDNNQTVSETPNEETQTSQGEQNAEAENQEPVGAPEKYEAFTLPEGVEMAHGFEDKVIALSKEFNLTQAQAQKIVDLGLDYQTTISDQYDNSMGEVRKQWVNDLKADPDFGGSKFSETVERAKRTLKKFDASEDFKRELEQSGYGDNPGFIKLLARIDAATGEDKSVNGGAVKAPPKTAASVLYPSMGKTN